MVKEESSLTKLQVKLELIESLQGIFFAESGEAN